MTNNIMIDIETLGTKPNAHILSIGVVRFNIKNGAILSKGYTAISDDQGERTFSADTVKFWHQNHDTFMQLMNEEKTPLIEALKYLQTFINPDDFVWAKSPAFDLVILKNAFKQYQLETPWKFWKEMDVRTVTSLDSSAMYEAEQVGEHHNALDDCLFQINCLTKFFEHHHMFDFTLNAMPS